MNILVVAAHPDDEVLGLGGTVARHVAAGDQVSILILADSGSVRYDDERMREVRDAARAASATLGVSDVRFGALEDQKLDVLPILEVTLRVEAVLQEVRPEIVYTHHRGDINRDHAVVHEATLTAARPYSAPFVGRILCYETPSATEWAGPFPESAFVPNVFVDIPTTLRPSLRRWRPIRPSSKIHRTRGRWKRCESTLPTGEASLV